MRLSEAARKKGEGGLKEAGQASFAIGELKKSSGR